MTAVTIGESNVVRVAGCSLAASAGRWAFADEHRVEIERHWLRRCVENPGYFNGTIFVLESHSLSADQFDGWLIPAQFKSFLYWKEHGYPDTSIRDTFGSALIRSADGHILLGRQRAGNINAGLAYLPGGFIDIRDVAADGSIDIEASVAREAREETGLGEDDFARMPGFILTFAGPMLSIAVEYRARLTAEALATAIRHHIAHDPFSELEDIVIVRSAHDLERLSMPVYAEVLLRALVSVS